MIAMMIVQTMSHTHIITTGSMAVCIFFTTQSISLLNFLLILSNKKSSFPVCSQIFTIEESSIGKSGFSFHELISLIHIRVDSSTHFDTPAMIFVNSFS